MQSAFELRAAGSALLAAGDAQQAAQVLGLIICLEGDAAAGLLRWLLPRRRGDAAHFYERWAAIAGLCRPDQVWRHTVGDA